MSIHEKLMNLVIINVHFLDERGGKWKIFIFIPHHLGSLGNTSMISDANYRLISGDDSERCLEVYVKNFTDLFIINFLLFFSVAFCFIAQKKQGFKRLL